MNLPFFSEYDDSLLRQVTTRDYLGLQTVWSSVARMLEPNLSGQVRNVQGIKAIGLMYYLINQPAAREIEKPRPFFKFIEGLFEYYLVHFLQVEPLYGKRIITQKDTVLSFTAGTVITGLTQYYRGSCHRAGLIASGQLCAEWHALYQRLLDQDDCKVMIDCFIDIVNQKEKTFTPAQLFKIPAFVQIFVATFKNNKAAFSSYFYDVFFASEQMEFYAQACLNNNRKRDGENTNKLQRIYAELSGNKDFHQLNNLKRYILCEPFLCFLNDTFHCLMNIGTVSGFAKVTALDEPIVKQKAQNFLSLKNNEPDNANHEQFSQLFALAELAEEGQWKTFAGKLIMDYHSNVMLKRKLDPLATIEGDKVVCVQDIAREPEEKLFQRIKSNSVMSNDYYTHATATIYRQLKEQKGGL